MPVIYDPAFQQNQQNLEFQKWASLGGAVNQLTNSLIAQREKEKERRTEIEKTLIAKGGVRKTAPGKGDPLLKELGYEDSEVVPPPDTGTGMFNRARLAYAATHPNEQGAIFGGQAKPPSQFTQDIQSDQQRIAEAEHQRKIREDAVQERIGVANVNLRAAEVGVSQGRLVLDKARLAKDDESSGWVMTDNPDAPMRPAKEGETALTRRQLADAADAAGVNSKTLDIGLKKTKNDLYSRKLELEESKNNPDLAALKPFLNVKESRLTPENRKIRDALSKKVAANLGITDEEALKGGGWWTSIKNFLGAKIQSGAPEAVPTSGPVKPVSTIPNPKGQESRNPFKGQPIEKVQEAIANEAVQVAQTTGKTPDQAMMAVFEKYGASPEAQEAMARMRGLE